MSDQLGHGLFAPGCEPPNRMMVLPKESQAPALSVYSSALPPERGRISFPSLKLFVASCAHAPGGMEAARVANWLPFGADAWDATFDRVGFVADGPCARESALAEDLATM